MLKLVSILLAGFWLFQASPVQAYTNAGEISSDETWSGTINLVGDVAVTDGVLTIEPGTVVKCNTVNANIIQGTASQIWIIAGQDGAIQAVGTESEPITFTSASATPGPGSWGQIILIALKNEPVTMFKHCIIEYARSGITMRNDAGLPDISAPVIDHCTFRYFTGTGMYGSTGCAPVISNCVIHDLGSMGMFWHGSNTIAISNVLIYNISCGIMSAGLSPYPQNVLLDHITIYNVDMSLIAEPKWWTGYGIFCTNDPGRLSLTNSIIADPGLYGLGINGWEVPRDYNCWYNGFASVNDGDPGDHSIEADPQFSDPDNGDFSLAAGSPCLNAASDGSNMGYGWQGAGIMDNHPAAREAAPIRFSHPVTKQLTVTFQTPAIDKPAEMKIYNGHGTLITELHKSSTDKSISWDLTNRSHIRIGHGIYYYRLTTKNETFSGSFLVSDNRY